MKKSDKSKRLARIISKPTVQKLQKKAEIRKQRHEALINNLIAKKKLLTHESNEKKFGKSLANIGDIKNPLNAIEAEFEIDQLKKKYKTLGKELGKLPVSTKRERELEPRSINDIYDILNNPDFQKNPYEYTLTIITKYAQMVNSKRLEFDDLKSKISYSTRVA